LVRCAKLFRQILKFSYFLVDTSDMNCMETSKASEEQPCVTWLLSVKNNLPFLRQTLQSIHCQTYRNHKLLVWDDCSTDGTLKELQRWVPELIPGKIFSGRSLRLGASLAFLVEQADTELCARIDGDDINFPQRLQRQVAFMQAHPEVGALGSLTEHIDDHGNPRSTSWYYPLDDAGIRWRSRWQASLCHPTVMFRRSVVLAAGNYRDFQVEDLDLWMRMSLITEFHNLAEPLVQYRRYDSSLTGQVGDFYPLDLKAATLNAPVLFSGIPDSTRALNLWRASHIYCPDPAGRLSPLGALDAFRNLKSLVNAGVAFARQVGKPDDYFLNTDLCKDQLYSMRRRFFENCGLAKVYAVRAHLAAARSRTQSPTAQPAELQPKSVQ